MPAHDPSQRRRTKRNGREQGCWAYVPAETLVRAGIDPAGPAPWYRTWGMPRGRVMLRLYRDA